MNDPSASQARFRALCEISRHITASLELEQVLGPICRHAAGLLRAEAALITSFRERASVLEVIATTPSSRISLGDTLSLESSLSGKAFRERRTLIVNDVAADRAADHALARSAGVSSAVVAPLTFDDRPLGTLVVWNRTESGEFDETDGELLEALAAQAAIAVRNASLYGSEHRRRQELAKLQAELEGSVRRLRGLVRAGAVLNKSLTLPEVLQKTVDSARDVLQARYAAMGVLDRSGKGLAEFVYSGVDREIADRIGHLPRGEGILGLIIREGQTLRLKDLRRHPDSCGFPEDHPKMTSFLGVPVRIEGGRVFGNLYMTEKVGGEEFTQEDEEIAELLATQAAVAIENASLYEQRTRFDAIVNHEIKNAAAGVLGWNDRLRHLTENADRRVRESAEYALHSARQLHRLVVDLLDLNRIEARGLELDPAPVDLRALVREVIATVRPEAEKKGVQVEAAGLDTRAITETDPIRVRQILLNLLSNAVKFSDTGGRIELALASAESGWRITVDDDGPGLDPGAADRLFEMPHTMTQGERPGTGLGLAISRELARLLGGDLSLDERPGRGACFRLRLPAAPSSRDGS